MQDDINSMRTPRVMLPRLLLLLTMGLPLAGVCCGTDPNQRLNGSNIAVYNRTDGLASEILSYPPGETRMFDSDVWNLSMTLHRCQWRRTLGN